MSNIVIFQNFPLFSISEKEPILNLFKDKPSFTLSFIHQSFILIPLRSLPGSHPYISLPDSEAHSPQVFYKADIP